MSRFRCIAPRTLCVRARAQFLHGRGRWSCCVPCSLQSVCELRRVLIPPRARAQGVGLPGISIAYMITTRTVSDTRRWLCVTPADPAARRAASGRAWHRTLCSGPGPTRRASPAGCGHRAHVLICTCHSHYCARAPATQATKSPDARDVAPPARGHCRATAINAAPARPRGVPRRARLV